MSLLVTAGKVFFVTLVAAAVVDNSFSQEIDEKKVQSAIDVVDAERPKQFFWQSEVLNKDNVQAELAKLYVTLHTNGVLSTKTSTIQKGETPTDVMIRAKVWPKWLVHRMPADLEASLCELNRDICSLSAKRSGSAAPDWAKAWPERTMNVPDVALKLTYQLSGREWAEFSSQVVQVDVVETSDFGAMWCRQFPGAVERCRGRDVADGWADDEPTIYKYTDDTNVLHKEYSTIGDPVALLRLGARSSPFKMLAVPVVEVTVQLQDSSPADFARITRSLSRSILVEQKLKLESMAADNKLQYVAMDIVDSNGIFNLPWPADLNPVPIRIAHIDANADLDHCSFGKGIVFKRYLVDPVTEAGHFEEVVRDTAPQLSASTASANVGNDALPACGALDPNPIEARSHGTHTLGILVDLLTLGGTMTAEDDPEIPPIVIYHIPVDLGPASEPSMKQLFQAINQLPTWGVSLVNISASWSLADTNKMAEAIDKLKTQTLFVVAAGNESQAGSCTVSPACLRGKNIISVVALGWNKDNNQLEVLEDSNRGLDHDIGAIGADVVSAASNNRVAKLRGTSQAAPMVSAVVAHLIRRGGLGLDAIYERIMTTANINNNLLGASQATMINMKRAVDVDSDFLDLKDGCQIKGRMEGFANDQNLSEKLILTKVEDEAEFSRVDSGELRRIFLNEMEGSHLVMYVHGRKLVRDSYFIGESDLRREFRFRPTQVTNCDGVQIGAVEKFKLANVRDLVMSPH